jgi:small subunit ribosomal protein S18
MAQKKAARTRGPKDANKKFKKKTSVLVQDKVEFVDYKDVNLLSRFVSDRSKIRSRRVSGNSTQQQREVATAIKNAREMGLMAYSKRVATTRTNRAPRDDDRGPRREQAAASTDVDTGSEVIDTGIDIGADDLDVGSDLEAGTATGADTDLDLGAGPGDTDDGEV